MRVIASGMGSESRFRFVSRGKKDKGEKEKEPWMTKLT